MLLDRYLLWGIIGLIVSMGFLLYFDGDRTITNTKACEVKGGVYINNYRSKDICVKAESYINLEE